MDGVLMRESCEAASDGRTVVDNARETRRLPRKVLHVLNSAGGGAALSTEALVEQFRLAGVEACAVCHDAGTPDQRERIRAMTRGAVLFTPLYWWNRKIRAAAWKRPLLELRQIMQTGWARRSAELVTRFAREQGADLIHTNTILVPEGGVAARRLGLPHVWHLRELLGPDQPFQLSKRAAALRRYLQKHASLIVANSHTSAKTAGEAIPADMLRIVPNGIDLSAFQPRREPWPAGKPLVVGMVAALTSRTKKHPLFIRAAAQCQDLAGVEFHLFGDDPGAGDHYAAELHQLVEQLSLGDRFRFRGHVVDPAQIMSQIDILVHPADNESFGRVAVEGMAAGLPVVGVRGGGVAEIVLDGETGLLVAPNDPQKLAIVIQQLARAAPLRERMGAAGRKRAEELYSIEACAAGMLRVYEEAMQRPLGSGNPLPRRERGE
jgi:glycosyltransferase involved in cell wall biosynthesis